MAALMEALRLVAGYGRVPVIGPLDIALGEGEVLVVQGPNGSGKTMLLLTLAGLLKPVAGRVLVEGSPSTRLVAACSSPPTRGGACTR